MPKEKYKQQEPPSLLEYYGAELTNFHLGDSSAESKAERIANQANEAGGNNVLATTMTLAGEIMSLPMQLGDAVMVPLMSLLTPLQGIACLPMASHLDPVVGLDLHNVTIPPSPAPVPLPHPFVSMVMDPKDWVACVVMSAAAEKVPPPPTDEASANNAMAFQAGLMVGAIAMSMIGMNATVKVGALTPRACTGAKNQVFPHFPMGAGFHPAFVPIKHNIGHVQLGSLFVNADYEPLAGLLHLNNDCWDVGAPELPRKKTKPRVLEFFASTGMVMAIPKGIIVNPVPTPINPLTAPFKLLKFGLAKALHGLVRQFVKNQNRANALHNRICRFLGHPVNVASGELYTDEEDFNLPGPIPLSFQRTWYSTSKYTGPLGNKWHHNYDRYIEINQAKNCAEYHMEDGRSAMFALPLQPGKPEYDRENKLFLHINEEGQYYISDAENLLYYFTEKTFAVGYTKDLRIHKLRSIANRNGFAIRFSYNAKGGLTKIIDSAGRVLNVLNDEENRIIQINAPHPEKQTETCTLVTYQYDDDNNLIAQTNATGDTMQYEYVDKLLVKETWQDGQQWFFIWEGSGITAKCVETWGGTQENKNIHYYKLRYEEGVTYAINGEGEETIYYHKGGLVYNEIDGNGKSWKKNYNKYNELEAEIDPLGNETRYTHDEWGNLCHITDADGGFIQQEYNLPEHPNVLTEWTDANGGTHVLSYDKQNNVVERVNPLKAKTHIEYEDGLPREIVNALGNSTLFHFDDAYNLTQVDYPTGVSSYHKYDKLGRNIQNINAKGVKQTLVHDLMGRVTEVHDFDGNHIQLSYDGIDNLIHYKDSQREIAYKYKGLFKLTGRSEAGSSVRFAYDSEQRLKTIYNEQNLPYRFTLDKAGNVIKKTQFDQETRLFKLDDAGRVIEQIDAGGKSTHFTHTQAGRLQEIQYHDGVAHTYEYNAAGKITLAETPKSTAAFAYDVLGNITQETVNGHVINHSYNTIGQRTNMQSSMGAQMTYETNDFGQLSQISAQNEQLKDKAWQAQFNYDALGLEIERLLPGNVQQTWKHDKLGRPTEQKIGHGGKKQRIRQYRWGINDRLQSIIDSQNGETQYQYDSRGYLNHASYANGSVDIRTADKVGNLYQSKEKTDRQYGYGGRLEKKGSWHYKYDDEGFLLEKYKQPGGRFGQKKNHWKYQWNSAGMLAQVTRPDGYKVSFTYDALGRRLSKKFKNTTTRWLWDGNVPLHEWKENQNGDILSNTTVDKEGVITWVFEENSFIPTAKLKENKKYSILADHLGTPTSMYNEAGEQTWERSLDSFGNVIQGDHNSCPFMYQGQYYDQEIELAYNRFRYFDPNDGRYISQDPIGLLSGEFGLYNYVSDPNGWVDVFGLAKSYDKKSERWRDTETGQYTTKPTNPGEMVHNGQINYGDIQQWASENGLTNNWHSSSNFSSGGFKYNDGTHQIHGHGANSNAPSGSNSANGPTASIKNTTTNQNIMSNGTSGSFGSDPNGAHIPLTGSPF